METLKTLFIAGLIAISFRSVAAEPFNILSGSMIPTRWWAIFCLFPNLVMATRAIPFSIALISGRVMASTPERGDVAVFRLPSDVSVDYIKRVVGLPGDRIQVKDGILHINGQPVERRFVGNGKIGSSQADLSPTVMKKYSLTGIAILFRKSAITSFLTIPLNLLYRMGIIL